MSRIARSILAGALGALVAAPGAAQSVRWSTTTVLYGDNTEFFTPYRVGETILGAQFFSTLRLRTGERTSVHLGVFGDHRSGGKEFWGGSFVADPNGRLLAKAGQNEELLVVPCDLSQVEVARTHWPFLRDRRIDAYAGLTERYLDGDR